MVIYSCVYFHRDWRRGRAPVAITKVQSMNPPGYLSERTYHNHVYENEHELSLHDRISADHDKEAQIRSLEGGVRSDNIDHDRALPS